MVPIRQALRLVAARPVLALVIVLTLALGLGAGLGALSALGAVLRSSLPYPEPNTLALVVGTLPERGVTFTYASHPNLQSWIESRPRALHHLEAVSMTRRATLTGIERPRPLAVEFVSHGFFDLLGIVPILGASTELNRDSSVLLSERLWRTQFQSDPAIVGRPIQIDEHPFEVTGVIADSYRGIYFDQVDLWLPVDAARTLLGDPYLSDRSRGWLLGIARLETGATEATAEMKRIAARLEEEFPKENDGLSATVVPLAEMIYPDRLRRGLIFLVIAGALVLAVCAANVANLQLAELLASGREIAVRRALGGGVAAAAGPYLLRTFLLALAGLALALACLPATVGALIGLSSIPPATFVARWLSWEIVVAGGLAVAVVVATLAGLFLWSLRRLDLARSLGAGGRNEPPSRRRGRLALAFVQIALAAALVIASGVLMRSLRILTESSPGFDQRRLAVLRISLPASSFADPEAITTFARRLESETAAVAGVDAGVLAGPLLAPNAMMSTSLLAEGADETQDGIQIFRHSVGPTYFATLGIGVLEGRGLDSGDRADATPVVTVSATVARNVWPKGALGQRFRTVPTVGGDRLWTVVGVVEDVKQRGHIGMGGGEVDVYFPFEQAPERSFYLLARSSVDPRSLEPQLHDFVHRIDSRLALAPLETMEQRYRDNAGDQRFATVLTVSFGLITLVLAAIGIHGMMAVTVTQRAQELGIRMALGASRRSVLAGVLRQGAILVGCGLAAGIVLAFGFRRLLEGFLFGVGPLDPVTLAAVIALLFVVAILSALGPAIRATRIDPATVMRSEG